MQTKVIKLDYQNPRDEIAREAAAVLDKGGIVILPTETVYGVAASMLNKEALERLYAIKQRPPDKPFAFIVERKDRIEELARNIPTSAYKLAYAFWPGALTLILKSKNSGTVGVRMPDDYFARRIVELLDIPLACPSANLSGKPAPKSFTEALQDLNGKVELALDGGNARIGEESTIVDLSDNDVRIVREGAISAGEIEKVAKRKTILFVCTGNSCRSVMAEALMKKRLKDIGREAVEVLSAGVMSQGGLGATEPTKQLLRAEGMDVSWHRSRPLTPELVKKTDLILVMEKLHEDRVLMVAPEVKNRVFLLKEFAKINDKDLNIPDPIGRTFEYYEEVYKVIKDAVEKVSALI